MRPRAILAEDESILRDQLRELLAAAWPELDIVALAEDGHAAIRAMERHRPDLAGGTRSFKRLAAEPDRCG